MKAVVSGHTRLLDCPLLCLLYINVAGRDKTCQESSCFKLNALKTKIPFRHFTMFSLLSDSITSLQCMLCLSEVGIVKILCSVLDPNLDQVAATYH